MVYTRLLQVEDDVGGEDPLPALPGPGVLEGDLAVPDQDRVERGHAVLYLATIALADLAIFLLRAPAEVNFWRGPGLL